MKARHAPLIGVLAVGLMSPAVGASEELAVHGFSDRELERKVLDDSWWLSELREKKALDLLARLDRHYYDSATEEEFRNRIYADIDLEGVEVVIQREGGEPTGRVQGVIVSVKGSIRPDMVPFGKLMDDIALHLAASKTGEVELGGDPETARRLASALGAYEGLRSVEIQQSSMLLLERLEEETGAGRPFQTKRESVQQANRQLADLAFDSARSLLNELGVNEREQLFDFVLGQLRGIYETQYAFLPIELREHRVPPKMEGLK